MKEFRCKFCHRLLAKIEESGKVEIKCPKCKTINMYSDEVVTVVEVNEAYLQKRVLQDQRVHYSYLPN